MFTDKEYKEMLDDIEVQKAIDFIYELVGIIKSGKDTFVIDYPGYGDLNVSIHSIDFTNVTWKPINVNVLDDVQEEYTDTEMVEFIGEVDVVKKRKVNNMYVKLEWFKL